LRVRPPSPQVETAGRCASSVFDPTALFEVTHLDVKQSGIAFHAMPAIVLHVSKDRRVLFFTHLPPDS